MKGIYTKLKKTFAAVLIGAIQFGVTVSQRLPMHLLQKVNEAISMDVLSGVIVKGPHGVGKSHSLVNLVLTLQASGRCLVTLVPDCE
jgi:hypothetical protein